MSTARLFFAFLCLIAIAACAPQPQIANGVKIISAAETPVIQKQHVDALNAFRAENGRSPVVLNAQLTAAARTHARDMSVQRRLWHFGSDGTSGRDRALRAGFQGRFLGENLSESFDDEVTLLQSWLSDPVTRRVMLAPGADSVGFGWYQEPSGKLWWVQVLGGSGQSPVEVATPGS